MKELPYFKFNCSEWISGSITLEDLTTQGAFINICAYYWFKSGNITLTEINRRLKLKQATINRLVDGNHIKLNGDIIEISFLREQFNERGMISDRNSKNGSKGGAPKGNKNAQKNNPEQPKTSNKEEEEEEEIDKKKPPRIFLDNYNTSEEVFEDLKNEYYLEPLILAVRGRGFKACDSVDILACLKDWILTESVSGSLFMKQKSDVRGHFSNWIRKQKPETIAEIGKRFKSALV